MAIDQGNSQDTSLEVPPLLMMLKSKKDGPVSVGGCILVMKTKEDSVTVQTQLGQLMRSKYPVNSGVDIQQLPQEMKDQLDKHQMETMIDFMRSHVF